jgi:hypothetical protein
MTKFDRKQFNTAGEYVTYGADRRFVARFKYGRDGKGAFVRFLAANFSVEEYFARLDAREAPLTILESRGYVSPNLARVLTSLGYPATQAGKQAYLARTVADWQARQGA